MRLQPSRRKVHWLRVGLLVSFFTPAVWRFQIRCCTGTESHSTMKYILLSLALATAAVAGNVSQYNVVWDSPSQNAHGSMPLGNGDISLNAWVEPSGQLAFYI